MDDELKKQKDCHECQHEEKKDTSFLKRLDRKQLKEAHYYFLKENGKNEFWNEFFHEGRTSHYRVLAKTDCHLITIKNKDFQKLYARIQVKHEREKRNFLKSIEQLQHCGRRILDRLIDSVKVKTYRRGQYLYKEGEKAEAVYIAIDGQFELCPSTVKIRLVTTNELSKIASDKNLE